MISVPGNCKFATVLRGSMNRGTGDLNILAQKEAPGPYELFVYDTLNFAGVSVATITIDFMDDTSPEATLWRLKWL